MTLDLDELERLEREATGGRWSPYFCTVKGWMVLGICADVMPTDARLIAAARNALPALLARVRGLEAELPGKMRVSVAHQESLLAELRALRAVAEAAERANGHEPSLCADHPCAQCDALEALDAALDAWRGLR